MTRRPGADRRAPGRPSRLCVACRWGGLTLAIATGCPDTPLAPVPVRLPAQARAPVVAPGGAPDEVVAWLADRAIPLATTEPGAGLDDLAPLGEIVGDARIIAVGEATHGTHEFFALKHRLLRYLVVEHGISVFAIEAPMAEAFAVDRYATAGEGTLDTAVDALTFSPWKTRELRDLLQWIREYNADESHTPKIRVYGIDSQHWAQGLRVALAYLDEVDPDLGARHRESLADLADETRHAEIWRWPKDRAADALARATALVDAFDRNLKAWAVATGPPRFARARQHAALVQQAMEVRVDPARRDERMADNLAWVLAQHGAAARAMVWAHNGHVSMADDAGSRRMGWYLREAFGPGVVTFGFAFDGGAFRTEPARGGASVVSSVGPAPDDTLDAALARVGVPAFAVDLRLRPAGSLVAQWLEAPHRVRYVGVSYDPARPEVALPSQAITELYDALLFVAVSTPSQPLHGPRGERPEETHD